MEQVFSFNRWLLLVGKHWSENRKKYLLSLVAMAGLLLIWFTLTILVERSAVLPQMDQGITYFVGLFLIGSLYGSMLFADLAGGPKAIHYLCTPASALEKLLTALLYGVVLFFACYTIIFYLVDIPMIKIANDLVENYWKEHRPGQLYKPVGVVNVFSNSDEDGFDLFTFLLLVYVSVQAVFILGSIYFPKYSFIKTAISVLVLFLFFLFLVANVFTGMLPKGNYHEGLTSFRLYEAGLEGKVIQLPRWVDWIVRVLFKYGFAPLFWVVTYFRLKEKEV